MKKGFLLTAALFTLAFPRLSHAELLDPTPTSVPSVSYSMPYPGLLPGHPFYVLKTTRDNIISFLISDPLKKADFDLLQSEKRAQGSYLLLSHDGKKINEAVTLFSKGGNYLEDAIVKMDQAKKQGMDTSDLLKRMTLSVKKQHELVELMQKNAAPGERHKMTNEHKRIIL